MSIVGSLSRKDVHGKDQYYLIILCTANYAWTLLEFNEDLLYI